VCGCVCVCVCVCVSGRCRRATSVFYELSKKIMCVCKSCVGVCVCVCVCASNVLAVQLVSSPPTAAHPVESRSAQRVCQTRLLASLPLLPLSLTHTHTYTCTHAHIHKHS